MLYQHPAKCFTQNCPNIDQKFETRICDVQILMPAPVLLKYIITFTLAFWGQICQLVSLWILFFVCLFVFLLRDRKGLDPEGKKSGQELRRVEGMETLQDILDEKTIFIILDRFLVMFSGFSIWVFYWVFCINVHKGNCSESVHNDMSILQPLKLGSWVLLMCKTWFCNSTAWVTRVTNIKFCTWGAFHLC